MEFPDAPSLGARGSKPEAVLGRDSPEVPGRLHAVPSKTRPRPVSPTVRGAAPKRRRVRKAPAETSVIVVFLDRLVRRNDGLTGNEFRLLACMALSARSGLTCDLGLVHLAELTGESSKTVGRHVRQLIAHGFLVLEQVGGRGRGHTHIYKLVLP